MNSQVVAKSNKLKQKKKIFAHIDALIVVRKNPVLLLSMEHVDSLSVRLASIELLEKNISELDVILHTPGGHIESAYKIVKLLRKHAKKVNIIIPSFAKSAGTLICLAGESLVLTTSSELGPLDVQIAEHQEGDVATYKSALNGYKSLGQIQAHAMENLDLAVQLILHRTGNRMLLRDVIKLAIDFSGGTSGSLYNQIHPKNISENARSLDVGEQYGVRILERYMGWAMDDAMLVVHRLVYDYPSHDFIIDREELVDLKLPVEEPEEDVELIIETIGFLLEYGEYFEIKFIDSKKIKKKSSRKNTRKDAKKKNAKKPRKTK